MLPAAHVLHDFWLDLVLGQVQGKDFFLPGNFQPIHVEFGQFHKVPGRGKRSARQKHIQMKMTIQQLSVSLDGGDHARHDIVATQETSDFRQDAVPRPLRQFSQQAPIKASVQPQPFGNRQNDLPVGDRCADFLGHMQRGQQGVFLVVGGIPTALLAEKGNKHLVMAVGATNPRKAFFQIATFKKEQSRSDRPQVARSRTWTESARHRPGGTSQNVDPSIATDRKHADRVADTGAMVWGRQAS